MVVGELTLKGGGGVETFPSKRNYRAWKLQCQQANLCEFGASLFYIATYRPSGYILKPCLKKSQRSLVEISLIVAMEKGL